MHTSAKALLNHLRLAQKIITNHHVIPKTSQIVPGSTLCRFHRRFCTVNNDNLGNENDSKQMPDGDSAKNLDPKITDYSYFKAIASLSNADPKKINVQEAIEAQTNLDENQLVNQTDTADLYKGIDVENIKPAIQKESYNLASFVSKSETLTKLVKLGVDLSKVEKSTSDANYILKLDFEKDIEPLLLVLHKIGVPDENLGGILSKNPGVFKVQIEDIEARVDYLESKKFSKADVARIVSKAPLILSRTTTEIDTQLGYLQREFKLTGDELRLAVLKCPKLSTWGRQGIKQVKFSLVEYMGFTGEELKQLVLMLPKIYTCNEKSLLQRFDYLHNEMGLSHEQILQWPNVLRERVNILRPRHLFLKHLGRDQYNPKETNFVSTKALVTGKDAVFCNNVAKETVKNYNDFLKTL